MIKDIVEPMFKTMLPGPLASLHFTKIDLGSVPPIFSNATTTKTEADGVKLNLNVGVSKMFRTSCSLRRAASCSWSSSSLPYLDANHCTHRP